MKILFFIPSLTSGGAERVLIRMANFWSEQNQTVSLLTLDSPQSVPFYPLHPKVQLTQLNLSLQSRSIAQKPIVLGKQLTRVRRQVISEAPDVLIAFLDIAIFLSLAATVFLPIKMVVSERNNPYRNTTNSWLQRLNNCLYRRADAIVLQTHQIARTFSDSLQPRIRVIPNPVARARRQVSDYPVQHHHKVIIAVGRLSFQKGFDLLIRALATLPPEHAAWQLRIVGTGEEHDKLMQLCDELSVSDRVTWVGRVTDVEAELLRASIFVLPSRFEGFPNALCEAMAVGLPAVATCCPYGPEEIIHSESNGLLVPVENAPALSQAMQRLIENPALSERLGRHAQKVTEQYGTEAVMARWEKLLAQVIDPCAP